MWGIQLFLHWLGFAVWLGAQLTFMVWGPAVREAKLEVWAHTWITLGRVQRVIVAPAAAVATITGISLTMGLAARDVDMGSAVWLMAMQGFGLLAGLLALGVTTPLANRMAALAHRSLEKGERDPGAERVRSRLALVGSITGLFIIVALYFGALKPVAG